MSGSWKRNIFKFCRTQSFYTLSLCPSCDPVIAFCLGWEGEGDSVLHMKTVTWEGNAKLVLTGNMLETWSHLLWNVGLQVPLTIDSA